MMIAKALFVSSLAFQLAYDTDPYRGYKQIGTTISCCGGNDCAVLPDQAVHAVKGGYQVDGWGFIPNERAQSGPDPYHYHLCHAGPTLYCFLTPAPGI
jgi:hypothetical protein